MDGYYVLHVDKCVNLACNHSVIIRVYVDRSIWCCVYLSTLSVWFMV